MLAAYKFSLFIFFLVVISLWKIKVIYTLYFRQSIYQTLINKRPVLLLLVVLRIAGTFFERRYKRLSRDRHKIRRIWILSTNGSRKWSCFRKGLKILRCLETFIWFQDLRLKSFHLVHGKHILLRNYRLVKWLSWIHLTLWVACTHVRILSVSTESLFHYY